MPHVMDANMDNLPLIVVIAVVALLYFWYVSIVSKRNKAREALSGIDVQLLKRHLGLLICLSGIFTNRILDTS